MEHYKQLRLYKQDMKSIRWSVYFFAITLIALSIWKYGIIAQEYIILLMNITSASIFIVLMEWSKNRTESAFSIGVVLSAFVFCIYLWAFGNEFDFFSIDTLLFVLIDTLLNMEDTISTKIHNLNKIMKESR